MKRIAILSIFIFLLKTAWAQSIAAEEILPQYIQGVGSFNNADERRVPYVCRLTINGLTAGANYRYFNRLELASAPTNANGVGTVLIQKPTGFVRITSPVLVGSTGLFGEFTASGAGSYTGWFFFEPTSGSHFTPGNQLQVVIHLNNGNGGNTTASRLRTSGNITVINFGAAPNNGTGLWSVADGGTPQNIVMLYDNENGTGRPIAGTFIEDLGAPDLSTANGYADFYANRVNGVNKAWGTIIPNNLTGGIKKIIQYSLASTTPAGTVAGSSTSSNGNWLTSTGETVSTANTTGGLTIPISLDGYDAALYPTRTPQTVTITSSIPGEIAIGDQGFTVDASATSGLSNFQYTASPSGVVSISGNTVTGLAAGTATIKVRQVGNQTYEPGFTLSSVITVKKKQNIALTDIPSKTYGDDVFTLDVFSDNTTIPIAVTSSDLAIAEVFYETLENRWKVQIHGAGDVDITVSQAANTEYQQASVTKQFSVQKKILTIKADNKTRAVNTANPTLTATYEGFIAGEDENDLTSPALLNTTASQSSAIGEYPITVSGAASPNYDITFEGGTLFVVNKLQTITFPAISNKMYGAVAFTPGATSDAGVAPVYTSSNSAVAVIENGEVQIKGVGQVRITATFPAVDDYAVTTSDRTFSVVKKSLTITAVDKTKTYGRDNPQLTVQYDGFVYDETGDALATKPVLQTAADKTSSIGSYTITVSGATSVNYDISYEYGTLLIERAPLHITAENKSKIQGELSPPLTVNYDGFVNGETTAVLNSLPALFTAVETSSPVGEYPITIGGASASNYLIQYHDGTFAVRQKTRTLTFNTLVARTYGDADFYPGAILSSGEEVEYSSSNPAVATIVNGKTHIITAGATDITATAPANGSYENTPVRTQRLVVNRAPQLITFAPIPDLTEGTPYELSASVNSGLPIEFTIEDTRIASLEGNQLIPRRAGLTRIIATQPGDTRYLPATTFTLDIRVVDAQGNFIAVHQALSLNGDGINEALVIDGIENYAENHMTIVNRNGTKVFELHNYDNQTNAFVGKGNTNYYGDLPQGTYFYVLEFKVNAEARRKTGFFILKY